MKNEDAVKIADEVRLKVDKLVHALLDNNKILSKIPDEATLEDIESILTKAEKYDKLKQILEK